MATLPRVAIRVSAPNRVYLMAMAETLQRILYCPDLHVPYHDKRAWKMFLEVGKAFKPDIFLSIGDFGDFYSVSSHSKGLERDRKLKWEMAQVNLALDQVDALGAKRKVFIAGNHESRTERYIQDKAPELFGVVDVPGLLNLKARGFEYIPYKKHLRIGKLYHTHDVGASGRSAPFRALDKYRHGVVTGHTHKIAYIVEGNLAGEAQLSYVLGWLGDAKQIDYVQEAKAVRDSALGFGVGYLNPKNGCVYLTPVPIIKYSCVVEGRLYRG